MKRACPFDTNVYRQTKIHINSYEYDQIAVKEAHENTMKKLLLGSLLSFTSQKVQSQEKEDAPVLQTAPIVVDSKKERILKQKQVTSYFPNNNNCNCCSENNAVPIHVKETSEICSYCDCKTEFVYQCAKCSESFCQGCSFDDYSSTGDDRICLTCS